MGGDEILISLSRESEALCVTRTRLHKKLMQTFARLHKILMQTFARLHKRLMQTFARLHKSLHERLHDDHHQRPLQEVGASSPRLHKTASDCRKVDLRQGRAENLCPAVFGWRSSAANLCVGAGASSRFSAELGRESVSGVFGRCWRLRMVIIVSLRRSQG